MIDNFPLLLQLVLLLQKSFLLNLPRDFLLILLLCHQSWILNSALVLA